ncbi:hypothetical protein Tco_0140819, partial [Tanacetum coccineum]
VAARFLYHLFLCDLSFAHLDKVMAALFLVAPKVGAATDALPAGVLKLDTHSSSKADPSESSPLPISVAPMIPTAPILPAQSAVIAPSHEFPLAPIDAPTRIRRRRAILIQPGEDIPIGRLYRTHPGGPSRALTARNSVRPLPSHRLALRHTPPDTTDVDSSTLTRFVHPSLARTLRCSEGYLRWRSASLSTMYPLTTSDKCRIHISVRISQKSQENSENEQTRTRESEEFKKNQKSTKPKP